MTMTSSAATRFAGYTALAGSACALSGAALNVASGADLDAFLASNDMAGYIEAARASSTMLTTNLTLWIVMALLMGASATIMTALSPSRPLRALIARYSVWVGFALVLAAYSAWLALVVKVVPSDHDAAVLVAETVGWFASRADWIATILVIGIGPTLLSAAGREDWVPGWLMRWGWVSAVAALLNALAMLTGGAGLTTWGFAIIPVGVGWMIAAGVVLLRR